MEGAAANVLRPADLPPTPAKPLPKKPALFRLSLKEITRVLDFLPLSSILVLKRISRKFRDLVNNTRQKDLFLIGPPEENADDAMTTAAEQITRIHPIFSTLYFYPGNLVTAIRTGSYNGPFLDNQKQARSSFATIPAVRKLTLRIIGGRDGNIWDGHLVIEQQTGITVRDLLKNLATFLDQEADPMVSFGDFFGEDYCNTTNTNPNWLMRNREFLDENEHFPRFWTVNPSNRNEIVCDYRLSNCILQIQPQKDKEEIGSSTGEFTDLAYMVGDGNNKQETSNFIKDASANSYNSPSRNMISFYGKPNQPEEDNWQISTHVEDVTAPFGDVEAEEEARVAEWKARPIPGQWGKLQGSVDSGEAKKDWIEHMKTQRKGQNQHLSNTQMRYLSGSSGNSFQR
ncbi:hypothetical protein BZA77DRAFT_390096 [Pyronema omphalodes]|nr:hypothetical protein BZA77DRAFT_390096 [Pyronema omphalodes]